LTRYLFVVPPLAGHTNPALAVGSELAGRGHQVAWAGLSPSIRQLMAFEGEVFAAVDETLHAQMTGSKQDWLKLKGFAGLKSFWEDFLIPLARGMFPRLLEICGTFRPDVVVADQQAMAGAMAARELGLRWATSATTSAELTRPLAGLPRVEEWVLQCQARLLEQAGQEPADLRFSDLLVLCFSTPDLIGPQVALADNVVCVGPAFNTARPPVPFDWNLLDGNRPRVLVSLGTLNAESGGRFFGTVAAALGDLAQLIVVAPAGVAEGLPAGCIVRRQVPQIELMSRVDLVISHGGHNTVCEALAHGTPLVVAPIRDDQSIVAQQVADSGAGLRVRFARLGVDELARAATRVLGEPSFREAARRIARSFEAAGGVRSAADHLERIGA
jgi:MGT family glycosyltransferase